MRVNIACGKDPIPGWINLDREDNGQEIVRDVSKGLPFSDNTVSEIICSHFLEHLAPGDELYFFLSELHRVCRDGAIIHFRLPMEGQQGAHSLHHKWIWNADTLTGLMGSASTWQTPKAYHWDFNVIGIRTNRDDTAFDAQVRKPRCVASGRVLMVCVTWHGLERVKRLWKEVELTTRGEDFTFLLAINEANQKEKDWAEQVHKQHAGRFEYYSSSMNLGWVGMLNEAILGSDYGHDYLIICNDDVLPAGDGWLPRLQNHFSDTAVGAVGPTSNYVIGRQSKDFDHLGVWEEETNLLIGFFMMIRREAWEEVGPLNDIYWQNGEAGGRPSGGDDLDYCIRLRNAGWRLRIARDVFVWHEGSKSLMEALPGRDAYRELCLGADDAIIKKWGQDAYNALWTMPKRVMIAVPCRENHADLDFAFSLVGLRKPAHFELVKAPRAHIDMARQKLAEFAIEKNFDEILFLDDDHELPPDLYLRLSAIGADVAGVVAVQRMPPFKPCVFEWGFNPDTGETGAVPSAAVIRTGIKKVDACGFAAMLIKTSVFTKLGAAPWFLWGKMGEDIYFCRRCKEAGVDIWCDTDIVLPHIGDPRKYTEDDLYKFLAEQKEKEGKK